MVDESLAAGIPVRRTSTHPARLRQLARGSDGADDWPSFSLAPVHTFNAAAWSPKIEVFERDGRFLVRADLPGVRKDDVSVEVADGQLAVSGKRCREKEGKKNHVYRSEREYGAFSGRCPCRHASRPGRSMQRSSTVSWRSASNCEARWSRRSERAGARNRRNERRDSWTRHEQGVRRHNGRGRRSGRGRTPDPQPGVSGARCSRRAVDDLLSRAIGRTKAKHGCCNPSA